MIAPPNCLELRDQNMQAQEFLQWSAIVLDVEFIMNYKTKHNYHVPHCVHLNTAKQGRGFMFNGTSHGREGTAGPTATWHISFQGKNT